MAELDVRGLTKAYGEARVLDDVSFTVGDGEFFTLLGPSGCGKSTTLNSIAGLDRPDTGRITSGDAVLVDLAAKVWREPEERNLGMVFQSYALWPHMTVGQNIGFPLSLRKERRAGQADKIAAVLDRVGLSGTERRYPHQLSGGQQQRVALARALVYEPRLLLLDEPLSNLDAKLREQARRWLKQLQSETGITTVYVTHDQSEALAMSDRIAVMGSGKMLQVGTPAEIYQHACDYEVATFVGQCSVLRGTVDTVDGTTMVRLDGDAGLVRAEGAEVAPGERAVVVVRPEQLRLASVVGGTDEVSTVRGKVSTVSYVGSGTEAVIETAAGTIELLVPVGQASAGDGCSVHIDTDHPLVFPEPAAP